MKKTVLITGTSSGVGKSTALYFQSKGWNVAATMRDISKGGDFHNMENIICLKLDVTDDISIKNAVSNTISHFGKIDVVINNAAYSLTGPFEAATAEQVNNLFDVDVFGVMNVTREILPYFRNQGYGSIINISSLGGRIGMPFSSFYASAKWALEGFSESIRFELEKIGVTLKIIEPGGIKTKFASNAIIVRKPEVAQYKESMEKRLAAYEKRKAKLTDPQEIAQIIYKATVDGKKKLRYLAGSDAKFFWKLYSVLPFGIFTKILKKMAG